MSFSQTADFGDEIVRVKQALSIFKFSRATLYRLIDQGRFPRPLQVTPGLVGWKKSVLTQHMEALSNA